MRGTGKNPNMKNGLDKKRDNLIFISVFLVSEEAAFEAWRGLFRLKIGFKFIKESKIR